MISPQIYIVKHIQSSFGMTHSLAMESSMESKQKLHCNKKL